jgi:hypothetical protein
MWHCVIGSSILKEHVAPVFRVQDWIYFIFLIIQFLWSQLKHNIKIHQTLHYVLSNKWEIIWNVISRSMSTILEIKINYTYIQTCKWALFQNKVLNKASRLYNKLPERIRILENFRSFKKEIKSLLIPNIFYSIDEFLNSNLY